MLLLVSKTLKQAIKKLIPSAVYKPALTWLRRPQPIFWGSIRRITPVSSLFGFDRGLPIDRHYIEEFLRKYSKDIKGRVLEIADPGYTQKFGGDRVSHSDVLHLTDGNPRATLIGNLATGEGIPKDCFDCMILTQTYHTIYDVKSALINSFSALKAGGVLLATLPGISQVSRYDMDRWGDYWRFTDLSAQRLFSEVFGTENVLIETHGNVLTAIAFLHGLSADELKPDELSYHDPDYQLLITVRAVKP